MLNTSSSAWRRASAKNAIFANGGLRWFRVPSLEARVEDCTRVVDMWLNGLGQANQKLVQRMVRLLAYQGHVDQARDVIKIGQRKAKAKFTDVGPYVPVLDVLTNRKMVAEAREVIAEMFEDELRITPACIHILVRLLRNTGDTLELLRVNNVELTPQVLRWVLNATLMNKLDLQPIGAELKNQGLKLDPGMYLCLMDDALARGKYDEFKEVSTRALSDEGVTRNEAFYSKLVALYSKARDLEGAKAAVEKMLDARIKPQRKTLMALADAFSRKNDVAGVRDVHSLAMQGAQDLRMRDIDRLTLSYMRCGDTASIEKLLDLTRNRQVCKSSMDRMEPPGSYFARLIINYARDGRIGDAYDLYEEAKRRRDTGLDCVYNAMIDAFGMNGQLGQALKTFHMVQNKTPATYEKLAKAYSLKKEVEGVVFCAKNIALLQPRRKYNVQVHLIRAFGLQRNLVSAKGAFDAVKDEVKGPTLAIYESMMHAYGHCGNPDGSILVLRELEERMGFTPNCFTMTHIVDAYGINGQYEKAYAVFENIMERGMLPDVHAYNSMIRAFCMSFKFGEAMGVLGNMLERNLLPNGHTCRAFLSAYLTLGDLTSACRIFELLLKVQPKPGYRAYEMLIEGFQSQANLQEAVNAFKDMRRVGIPTDDELIDRIVAFKHETALEGAREGFHKHLKRGMPTSVDQPVADGTLLTEGRNHGFSTP